MREIWPNLFIVGSPKSGTSSVYEYLKQHPQVHMSPFKEPHFFSSDHVRIDRDLVIADERAYLRLFSKVSNADLVGEASTSYLWHPDVPRRIKAKCPDARIIIILRDPVERAHSQYLMDIMDGFPPKPFYDVLLREIETGDPTYGTGRLYITLGKYADPVGRYFEVFGRDHVLVLMFEDLKQDASTLLARIADFLEIDQTPMRDISVNRVAHNPYLAPAYPFIPYLMRFRLGRYFWRQIVPCEIRRFVRYNVLTRRAPKSPIDPRAADFLKRCYASDIAELEVLLERPLPELRATW